jgi:hypothetical protein
MRGVLAAARPGRDYLVRVSDVEELVTPKPRGGANRMTSQPRRRRAAPPQGPGDAKDNMPRFMERVEGSRLDAIRELLLAALERPEVPS